MVPPAAGILRGMTSTAPQQFTPGVRDTFLKELAKRGIVGDACRAVGVSRSTVNRYLETNPAFAEAYASALEDGIDQLEIAAFDRAVNGVTKGVYHQGIEVARERVYSDGLLQMLLTRRRYPERVQNDINANVNTRDLTPEKRASLIQNLLNRAAGRRDAKQQADDLT